MMGFMTTISPEASQALLGAALVWSAVGLIMAVWMWRNANKRR